MNNNYINEITNRRSIYNLGKNVSLTQDELVDIIEEAIRQSPSAFNSQSVRAIILFDKAHDEFWEGTLDILHGEVPNETAFENTKNKVEGSFKSGVGTVLFFTDEKIIDKLKNDFPIFSDNIDMFGEHALGIANANVWTALASAGVGASLQHYNPIVDKFVQDHFDVPANWTLKSQMPFGSIEAPADGKDFMTDEDRFRVIK
ncbi:nitroreductase family protein [Pediococcus claussenii]|uniref:Nitroreductase family protein n=1 Tax=Pediococcus claussenii (strain ATCC BAA-344 / DSM 14800 / JCM 18046 / KCTC 3811 / LMG 21948 / P06) TaxID=701521 RepID=G8PB90_PEDCP|nr:nitroreductase family protein [Pediococcus claussenii]AEV94719.1 nitroreductase family protein [Pediococcus claussenii ATCC BAA-344]ANZ69914.1 nitroreductase [Pediococcus claussenii]ANZ71731.1 nitroreductase [Pediococcus claussenii]KRN20898.1 hypothetical protein IV79_GL000123 [Pediococcus claussenii]